MTKIKRKIIKKIGRAIFPKRKPPKRVTFPEEVRKAILRYQRYECANFKCHNKRFLEFDHIRGNHEIRRFLLGGKVVNFGSYLWFYKLSTQVAVHAVEKIRC